MLEDRTEVANYLNKFFATIGEKLASDIPPNSLFSDYNPGVQLPELNLPLVTPELIRRVIRSLKPKRSASFDLISKSLDGDSS
jgi:hypothetical protein